LKNITGYQARIDAIKINLDSMNVKPVLCNGDPCVSSNMPRLKDGSVKIIDWEYAGMADQRFKRAGISGADRPLI